MMWLPKMSRLDPGTAQVKTSNHIERYDYKCEQATISNDVTTKTKVKQATISNDVITKSETTMWLSQVNQATISDDVITKGVST